MYHLTFLRIPVVRHRLFKPYPFVGPGAPASFTTTSPTSVVNLSPSSTYTVIHTVVNSGSCTATNSMVVNVGAGPSAAFTTPTYTQCLTGNAFTFNAATAAGTTYAFNPTAVCHRINQPLRSC